VCTMLFLRGSSIRPFHRFFLVKNGLNMKRIQMKPMITRFYSTGRLSREDIEARIIDIVKSFDKVTDPSKITSTSSFSTDLGLDSLDTVEVVMAIEEAFNIEIPDKEADEIRTIGDAISYISSRSDGDLRLAEITEMIHTASLLHDDVIDNSEVRRGMPSGNHVFGSKMAVLAGDFLLGRASIALARLRNAEVIELLATVIANLVEGEFMQLKNIMDKHDNDYPVFNNLLNNYLKKTYLKTASLIAKSCRASALLGGCTSEIADHAYLYGKNFGLAFQLTDDMLDYMVSEDTFGKPIKTDLKQGLVTAPVLFAWEKYPELTPLIKRKFSHNGDIYRLKQVRERLAKGLVDKGILRTEKRNFLLFDMTTHPVSNTLVKDDIRTRLMMMLTASTIILPNSVFFPETISMKHLRVIALVCAAYAANVLENVFLSCDYETRERAFNRVDEFFKDFSQWPFTVKHTGNIGCMDSSLANVVAEEIYGEKDKEQQLEVIAAVFQDNDSFMIMIMWMSSIESDSKKDAIYAGLESMMISGSIGLVFSALQNALIKESCSIKSILKRTGGTVATLAAMGGLFSFSQTLMSNLRQKDDPINSLTGGVIAGSIGAIRARSLPVMVGYGLGLGSLLYVFDLCGGTLNGIYENSSKLRETFFKTEYRRPRSEIVKAIGGGRGV
ncbi:hypothetical protein PCK2_000595, partial [Pneumocystis canis]